MKRIVEANRAIKSNILHRFEPKKAAITLMVDNTNNIACSKDNNMINHQSFLVVDSVVLQSIVCLDYSKLD